VGIPFVKKQIKTRNHHHCGFVRAAGVEEKDGFRPALPRVRGEVMAASVRSDRMIAPPGASSKG
jgi:hypothetical protein